VTVPPVTDRLPALLDAKGLAGEWRRSRIDVAEGTVRNYNAHLGRILPAMGNRDPHTLTTSDVQTWVATITTPGGSKPLTPSSVPCYMGTLRTLLDFAGVDPNPVRDSRVKAA
jgi:Phage integrase, N-terminal SAM-like domain